MKARWIAWRAAAALACVVFVTTAAAQPHADVGAAQAQQSSPELGRGQATWYGAKFHGRRTSSGERFDMNELTAAHETLPFGTLVRVRNVANGREVVVRINDRAPRLGDRIIDLSRAAASALGFVKAGRAPIVLLAR